MNTTLPHPEPAAGPWSTVSVHSLLDAIRRIGEVPAGRPRVVAIDGRGAGGKSTLAALLNAATPSSAVVHTDDIAWNEPLFTWGPLLLHHILEPVRNGMAVDFQPPAWADHGRTGAITVTSGLDLVIVEGVGSAQRAVADLLVAVLWVQSDFAEAERRGIARDVEQGVNGDAAQTAVFWHEWMAAELTFVAADRPWERCDLVVAGTPSTPHRPDEVVIAAGPLLSPGSDSVLAPNPGGR